jgi:hypothetical protein
MTLTVGQILESLPTLSNEELSAVHSALALEWRRQDRKEQKKATAAKQQAAAEQKRRIDDKEQYKARRERDGSLVTMRESGQSVADIAKSVGLSRIYVSHLIRHERWVRSREKDKLLRKQQG